MMSTTFDTSFIEYTGCNTAPPTAMFMMRVFRRVTFVRPKSTILHLNSKNFWSLKRYWHLLEYAIKLFKKVGWNNLEIVLNKIRKNHKNLIVFIVPIESWENFEPVCRFSTLKVVWVKFGKKIQVKTHFFLKFLKIQIHSKMFLRLGSFYCFSFYALIHIIHIVLRTAKRMNGMDGWK